jgi:hypothetical protein
MLHAGGGLIPALGASIDFRFALKKQGAYG